jgi:MoaA/NifB/PqqE/SkfB family radical SAM enzyme
VEWAVLSGGEPLMNRDLPAICEFFRDLGIRLSLLTTGTLLARRAAEVAAGFNDVIVSLDGPAAVHDAIRRVPGSFEHIRAGVAAVRRLRPGMRITARTTVQKKNHTELLATVLAAHDLGLDGISFLAADLTSEAFNRSVIWPGDRQAQIALSTEEVRTLAYEIEQVIGWSSARSSRGFVAEAPEKLRRIVHHFRAHLGHGEFEAPRCNAPWVSAVIEADGSVRPCFFHPPVGNATERSLEAVVNGPAAREFRRNLDVASNPVCQRCVCSLYRPDPPIERHARRVRSLPATV